MSMRPWILIFPTSLIPSPLGEKALGAIIFVSSKTFTRTGTMLPAHVPLTASGQTREATQELGASVIQIGLLRFILQVKQFLSITFNFLCNDDEWECLCCRKIYCYPPFHIWVIMSNDVHLGIKYNCIRIIYLLSYDSDIHHSINSLSGFSSRFNQNAMVIK